MPLELDGKVFIVGPLLLSEFLLGTLRSSLLHILGGLGHGEDALGFNRSIRQHLAGSFQNPYSRSSALVGLFIPKRTLRVSDFRAELTKRLDSCSKFTIRLQLVLHLFCI